MRSTSADNKWLNRLTLIEKIASFLSYFTFGLLGIIFIIANYFSGDMTNKFTLFHTVQSLLFGIVTTFIASISGLSLSMISFYHFDLGSYNQLIIDYCLRLPQLTFLIACIFGISVFTGNTLYLPGVKKFTHNFFNQ